MQMHKEYYVGRFNTFIFMLNFIYYIEENIYFFWDIELLYFLFYIF